MNCIPKGTVVLHEDTPVARTTKSIFFERGESTFHWWWYTYTVVDRLSTEDVPHDTPPQSMGSLRLLLDRGPFQVAEATLQGPGKEFAFRSELFEPVVDLDTEAMLRLLMDSDNEVTQILRTSLQSDFDKLLWTLRATLARP